MRAVGAQGDGAGTLGLARTRLTFVRTRPEAPRVPSEAGVMGPLCRRGAVCRVRPRASSCVGVRGRECACGPAFVGPAFASAGAMAHPGAVKEIFWDGNW